MDQSTILNWPLYQHVMGLPPLMHECPCGAVYDVDEDGDPDWPGRCPDCAYVAAENAERSE